MPHEEEHSVVTGTRVAYDGYYTSSGSRVPPYVGCGASYWRKEYHNVGPTPSHVYGRCASQHTPIDKWGWRAPQAYWAYDFRPLVSSSRLSSAAGGRPTFVNYGYLYGNDMPTYVSLALPSGFSSFRPYFASLENEAITEALAELGEATAELGVELREVRKTADFVTSKLKSLAENVNDVVHRRVPRAWKHAKRASKGDIGSWAAKRFPERWMEYRYAWSPTVLGIYDAIDLIDNRTKERPMYVTTRKSAEAVNVSSSTVPFNQGGYYPWKTLRTETSEETDRVYVVITTSFTRPFLQSLNEAGVVNPASVLWETIPFSWMADWFVNFGDYFNAQFAALNCSLKGGTATHYWSRTNQASFVLDPGAYVGPQIVQCNDPVFPTVTAGGTSFNRRVLSQSDLTASLHFNGDPLNLLRAGDIVSLLAGVFQSHRGTKMPTKGLRL